MTTSTHRGRRAALAVLVVAGAAVAGLATAGTASAASTRTICAQDVTVRVNEDGSLNQPVGYLRKGDPFLLDHYSPSGGYAVGVGTQANGHTVSGYVISDTITDASGHCQGPYA